MLADKLGGARVTIVAFSVMAVGVVCAIFALRAHAFGPFLASFLVLFRRDRRRQRVGLPDDPRGLRFGAGDAEDRARRVKAAAGCLGIAGAVGAFGGFLIPRGFAVSTSLTATSRPPSG